MGLVSCATDVTPSFTALPQPPKIETVVPNVLKVDETVDKSIEKSKELEAQLKTNKQIILEQKIALEKASKDVEKIRDRILANEAITEIDALNLLDQLDKIGKRNLFLETQNEILEKTREEQAVLLDDAKTELDTTLIRIIQKEEEAMALRTQNEYLRTVAEKKSTEVTDLQKQLTKSKEKAATAGVYRNWIIGLVSLFVLWTIIKNILMMYNPLASFRV